MLRNKHTRKIYEGNSLMRVAVIIVEFNDAEETIKYVKKIETYQNIQRVVVVDNHSTDLNAVSLLKEVQSEKVLILQADKNGGYNYGNNFGIRYLERIGEKYDYFIISNPDVEVKEMAIQECLNLLEKDEMVGITAPRMLSASGKPIRRSSWKTRTFGLDVIHATRFLELLFYPKLRSGEYLETEYRQKYLSVEAISGAFFIIKSDVWQKIGGFDEKVFLFYEEDILAKKMQEIGKKIVSCNEVNFRHYESQIIGKTLSYYSKMQQLYKSKMYYHKTYHHISGVQILIFEILQFFRNIELLLEIPIRKILKK